MAILAKFKTGKQDQKLELVLLEPQPDKKGYPLIVADEYNGNELPPKFARVYLKGKDDSKFFTISGPIRELDENGIPVTRAKQNDGQYIDKNGMPTNEGLAARENVYIKNGDTGTVVYSDLGTINLENTKADNTPTKFTLARVKLFSEQEALTIAKMNYLLADTNKQLASDLNPSEKEGLTNKKQALENDIKETMKTSGTTYTMFINAGADFLRDAGFEVRIREREHDSAMGMQ